MKNFFLTILIFALLLLFIIQSVGTLVESIYILDLMNSNLDEKALGVLFFFTPLLVFPFLRKYPRQLGWTLFILLLVSRGLTPYLSTANRLTASGVATGASLTLLFLLICITPQVGRAGSAGLAMAVALSTLLRAAGEGIEYSLTSTGGWVGWGLGLLLGGFLAYSGLIAKPREWQVSGKVTAPIVGIYLILTLIYFSFSAPSVIARWTEGNYLLIVSTVSLLSLGYVWLSAWMPQQLERLPLRLLIVWNLLFTASLTSLLLAHRVVFPRTLDSPAVVVSAPGLLQQILLGLMLILFPVTFLDLQVFLDRIQSPSPTSPNQKSSSLVAGILLGTLSLVVLIFANIFTNVWGYIDPVSPIFRNTFWLSYFILSMGISLLVWLSPRGNLNRENASSVGRPWIFTAALAIIFLATLVFALPSPYVNTTDGKVSSLRAMTFNTQQSNAENGEKSVDAQLALIRQVSPDILALQESDSSRISLNNNDYVRYFAEKLGFHSYYGPKTLTGTFGTAILSKYPLMDTRTVFIYSDKDETGVAEAEIDVEGNRFTIYNVHPDSSDPAMLAFATILVARSQDKSNVIALGDFNLRDYEVAYQVINNSLTNAWVSNYPSKISPDGIDMSGDNRIDHIFHSPDLRAIKPTYILPPESATDHPVHWAEILWDTP